MKPASDSHNESEARRQLRWYLLDPSSLAYSKIHGRPRGLAEEIDKSSSEGWRFVRAGSHDLLPLIVFERPVEESEGLSSGHSQTQEITRIEECNVKIAFGVEDG